MPTVFVSHRLQDYEAGVADVIRVLSAHFGPHNVLVDRYSFLPGSSWLSQLRAQVVSADIVVCIVGPAWASSRDSSQGTDYVIEELTIARQLRKQVIPIVLGKDRTRLSSLIPPKLKWLLSLQFLTASPETGDEALLQRLRECLPTASEATASSSQLWTLALTRLSQSMVSPVRSAAAAFHPSRRTVATGAIQLCFATVVFGVAATLTVDRLDIVSLVRGSFFSFAAVAATASWLGVFSWLARVQVSPIGFFGFAAYLIAALMAAASFWTAAFVSALPEGVLTEMMKRISAEDLAESMRGWDPGIHGIRFALVTSFNWLCGAHLLFILWGYSRAASMVLGWRSWIVLALISIPATALLSILLIVLFLSIGSR